jgi:hypothetical protein
MAIHAPHLVPVARDATAWLGAAMALHLVVVVRRSCENR